VLAAVVEMVHVATLVHDDVLDGGDLRRQAATVNRRWGNAPAVLLGDILFSHAYRLCSQLAAPRAAQVIAQTAVTVCEGELMQIANRQNYELTEEEYLDIVAHKTAALIGACTLLGAEYAGADERTSRQMERFGRALGVAFQITDDVLDLVGSEAVVGKSLGRDAELGELTLPLIHLLREQGAGRSEVLALLRSTAAERTGRLAGLLESSGSIGYAQSQARGRLEEALSILAGLPESEARDSLRAMAEFVLSRGY
jgi:octaprenyl-diphosphate synthase